MLQFVLITNYFARFIKSRSIIYAPPFCFMAKSSFIKGLLDTVSKLSNLLSKMYSVGGHNTAGYRRKPAPLPRWEVLTHAAIIYYVTRW